MTMRAWRVEAMGDSGALHRRELDLPASGLGVAGVTPNRPPGLLRRRRTAPPRALSADTP